MGFLGILEDKYDRAVPGTVILDDVGQHHPDSTFKHGKGKNSHIVLAPQPSDDPNDPLNFSYGKKLRMLAVTAFGTTLFGATVPPLLNAGLVEIATDLGVSLDKIVLASGYQLLVVAGSITIVNALARRWGKRPVFLGSALFGIIGSIVGSSAQNYEMLFAARIIQGFSSSAFESLILSMIGDLFFVHERGLFTSIITFMLATVANFSSIITGPVAANLGWRYLFHLLIVFGGFQIILQFFLVPESQFRRDQRYNIDETGTTTIEESATKEMNSPSTTNIEQVDAELPTSIPRKKSYVQELALYTESYSNENLLQLILGPFGCFLNLSVAWCVIIGGFYLSLYVAVAYLLAQIFSYAPYYLDASGVGFLSVGPFLGGLISSTILAVVSDPLVRWCIHRNNGVYEPEFRLLLCPVGLLAVLGFILWGYVVENLGSYYLTAFLHGLGLFGITFILVTTANYCLDAYREMSSEIFLASMCVKNILIFCYSYFVNDWDVKSGPLRIFVVLGAVAAGMTLMLPVVFVYGKRYRSWWGRNNLMKKFHILTHEE